MKRIIFSPLPAPHNSHNLTLQRTFGKMLQSSPFVNYSVSKCFTEEQNHYLMAVDIAVGTWFSSGLDSVGLCDLKSLF